MHTAIEAAPARDTVELADLDRHVAAVFARQLLRYAAPEHERERQAIYDTIYELRRMKAQREKVDAEVYL